MMENHIDVISTEIENEIDQFEREAFKPNLNDPLVLNHKTKFEEWLAKEFSAKNTSKILKKADIDQIYDVLKGNKKLTKATEKFQFKKKNFLLLDNKVGRVIDNKAKPIAFLEDFFEIIYEIHCRLRLHPGIVKTYEQVCHRFHGITKEIVAKFRDFVMFVI